MLQPTRRLADSLVVLWCVIMAACGTSPSITRAAGGGNIIPVVAVESFWGSIARQVGGNHVSVTSIIADPNADPHNHEPTAIDATTLAAAKYVIINGVGYDPWASKLLAANPVTGRRVLNVGTLNGKKAGDNPHVWYNPAYITVIANKIRDDLKALDSADASAFDQSTQSFLTTGLQRYHALIADIRAKYSGVPVGATESIFAYLAPALGVNLITPDSYLKAVSEGEDISAADEATVEQQIKTKAIKVLVFNSQNTPNNIQNVITLAKAHNIPTPMITETLTPANASFQDWQATQLQGIEAALAQATGK